MHRAVLVLVVVLACGVRTALSVPSVYEGFSYGNDVSALSGQAGGYGWAGPWVEIGDGPGDDFLLTQDDTSLTHPSLPFTPTGDRVIATGPGEGGNNNIMLRQFATGAYLDLAADGSYYASFLMQKAGSEATSGDNMEVSFNSGGATVVRMGSTSGDNFFLGALSSDAAMGENLAFGNNYFVVVRVDASAADVDTFSMSMYDPSDAIPGSEPGAWDLVYETNSNALIDGTQMWIGTNASGTFDELRFGRGWEDVTSFAPDFLRGDFDNSGQVDSADLQAISDNLFTGGSYAQGDIDTSGLVDLTDFAIFREIYAATPAAAESTTPAPAPEPGAVALTLVGCLLSCNLKHRRRGARPAAAMR